MSGRFATLALALLLLPLVASVPPPGPEMSPQKYRSENASESWNNDISTGGIFVKPPETGHSTCRSLGFVFTYFDANIGCAYIHDDGLISFSDGGTRGVPNNNANYPLNWDYTIAALYTDFDLDLCNGEVRYGTKTVDGVTSFYVQWINVFNTGRIITECDDEVGSFVQLRLEAGTNDVFVYVQTHAISNLPNARNGEIGIEGSDVTQSIRYGDANQQNRNVRFYANSIPFCPDDYHTVPIDGSVSFTLSCQDDDGDAITSYILDTSEVTSGTITGTAPSLTYNAPPEVSPQDVLKYRATDALGTVGSWGSIYLNTMPINKAPSFDVGPDLEVEWGDSIHIYDAFLTNLNPGVDEEDQELTVSAFIADSSMFLTYPKFYVQDDTAQVLFRLQGSFVGTIPVEVVVTDNGGTLFGGIDTSESQYFNIIVNEAPPHKLPIAEDIDITVPEDTPITFSLIGYDPENEPVTFHIDSPPTGTLTLAGQEATYQSVPDTSGVDTFTYFLNDGELNGESATVTITVTPVNDAPRPKFDVLQAYQDSALFIEHAALLANDVEPEGETMSVTLAEPTYGYLVANGMDTDYVPSPDFFGLDESLQTVSDPHGYSSQTELIIGVSAFGNDLPVANGDALETDEDVPLAIGVEILDNDDGLEEPEILWIGDGTLGSVEGMTYTPLPDQFGVDTLTYLVHDGFGGIALGTITLTVHEVQDPPQAEFMYDTHLLALSQFGDIQFTDSSVAGDSAIVNWAYDFGDGSTSTALNPQHAYLTTGEFTVTLTVTDALGQTDTAVQTIAVTNAAPTLHIESSGAIAHRETILSAVAHDNDGLQAILWDLGNGWTSSGVNVRHSYPSGTYVIMATAIDNLGASSTAVHVLTVAPGQPTDASYAGSGGNNHGGLAPIQATPKFVQHDPQPEPPMESSGQSEVEAAPEVDAPEPVLPVYQASSEPANNAWAFVILGAASLLLVAAIVVAMVRRNSAKA